LIVKNSLNSAILVNLVQVTLSMYHFYDANQAIGCFKFLFATTKFVHSRILHKKRYILLKTVSANGWVPT